MHPTDLGNRLLRSYTDLRDAYVETATFDGCEDGMTMIVENPNNDFVLPEKGLRIDYILFKGCEDGMTMIVENPNNDFVLPEKGLRIDYILFKGSARMELHCDSMSTTKGSVPDHAFPYSDHEALNVELRLDPVSQDGPSGDGRTAGKLAELVDLVTEARTEVKVGLHCAQRMCYTAARTGAMGLALLLLELAIAAVPWLALGTGQPQPFPSVSFYLLGALCFAILLTTALLYVFYTNQIKCLQEAEDQMRLSVGCLQERLRGLPAALGGPSQGARGSPEKEREREGQPCAAVGPEE
ncbi:hypothetical protein CRUP_032519 [Coryphaenoides rupestris]|nr:hypothetical protein CRUP_032519 [Coryphaenoides rupestris]